MRKKSKQKFPKQKGNFLKGKKSLKQSKQNFAKFIEGIICGTSKGFAFFRSNDLPDLFIPERYTKGAIEGDKVAVRVLSLEGEKGEAKVEKILMRANHTLVGLLIKTKNEFLVKPDNNKISKFIKIEKRHLLNAEVGQKVVCKLLYQPENVKERILGEIIEVLGDPEANEVMELSIMREYHIYETYPQEVIAQAQLLEKKGVTDKDKRNRKDLTKQEIFTIDGADAKDLDDAVSLTMLENGNYCLGVHIADVGHYVTKDSVIDKEAFMRGTSVYFPTMTFAMLPKSLSNGICSLSENVERLTLSVEIEIDKNGDVKNHKIFESYIKSVSRLTYDEVYQVLIGKDDNKLKASKHKQTLLKMLELSNIIKKKRQLLGELDFDIAECEFVIENDIVTQVKKRERNDAHKLIENFMIMANQVIAEQFCLNNVPFAYRVHEKPTKEKVEGVVSYLEGIGLTVPQVPDDITTQYYSSLIQSVEDTNIKESLNKVILRSMQKAKYAPQCLGHFGLGLTYYCHFTSPIRRYPDLTIHRIIKDSLKNKSFDENLKEFVFEACEQSSLKERNADEAERAVDDLKKAQYMVNHIGEEYEGVVSSVTNFGLFVELENGIEGLIRVENLPENNYLFFEKSLKLKGQNTCYSLGDKIKIRVLASNIYERKIEFGIV